MPSAFRVSAGFDSGRGRLWGPEWHRRARCGKPAVLFFVGECPASSCWYLCWYRQQCKKISTFNSNGYGIKRLSARGTKLKTLIITTTYAMGWIPDFQKYFLGTLKIHVKIHSSRPFCWHFCWYRGIKRSRRISLFLNYGIEQMDRKNDGAAANPKQI